MCITNTISAVRVTLPSSERERNSLGSVCIPESAHAAQVSTTLAMFWLKSRTLSGREESQTDVLGEGGAEVCCSFPVFSSLALHCNSHSLTAAASRFFPTLIVVLSSVAASQGLQVAQDSAVPTGKHLHGSSCDLIGEKWTESMPIHP